MEAKRPIAIESSPLATCAYLADDLPYLFLWKLDTKSAWRTEVKSNTISPYFYFTEFDSRKYDG